MLVLGSFNEAQALVGAFSGHCEASLGFYYPRSVVLVFVAPGVAAGGAAPPAAGCCLLPLRSGEWAALRRGGNIHNYFSASHKLRQSVVWNSEPSD